MIQRINQTFNLSQAQDQFLQNNQPFGQGDWGRLKTRHGIYNSIFNQLHTIQQGKCCYCGLKYNTTGRAEVEHIAPHSSRERACPEFSFTKENLALSCQFCNSSSKKGEYDPIVNYSPNHMQCTFRIVHPHFDEPNIHYGWNNRFFEVLISGKTPKGRESIRLFELASEEHTEARAEQRNLEKLKIIYNLPVNVINRIKTAVSFKRTIG
jgi:uncharacterized protein (TIGR02646 family)